MMMCSFDEWAEAQSDNMRLVAEHVNTLYRRIAILENVIADDLALENCSDELNRAVVEAVLERRGPVEPH
jgi:hypothetical protein